MSIKAEDKKRIKKHNIYSMVNQLKKNFKYLPKEKKGIIKIIGMYIIISELWILISDTLIYSILNSSLAIMLLQKIKGSIFIIITACFFYLLIRKYTMIITSLRSQLEITEEQYKFVIDNTTEGLWVWNIETNENILSSKWKENLGYKEHEIPNTLEGWKNLLHPDDVDWVVEKTFDYVNKKILKYKLEYRMKKKNGDYIWILDQGQGIWDKSGKPISMIGTHSDITERKKSEIALKESEKKFKALFNNADDAIALIELKENGNTGRYIEINDSACRRLGYNKNELLNIGPYDIRTKEGKLEFDKTMKEFLKTGQTTYETVHISKKGDKIPVEINWHICDFNDKKAILSIARDITERKKTNEKLLKMVEENKRLLAKTIEHDRIKTQFFSNISHEFKTPLNVILGIVQLLSSYKNDSQINIDPKNFNKYIDITKQNCYRLLRLINNLIDITRIDSDFFELNYKNYNIIGLVEDITLSVVEFAKNQGISIVFDTELEEKIIACDADKIERIVLNILSNSIKNTKTGGRIYVNIYDKKDNIIISIKDTGIGIPKDKLEVIFERFGQVDSSLTRLNEGSGIGLSLVKSLVEKHKGEIWVESEQGVGTEIFIKLPVRVLDEEDEYIDDYDTNDNLVEKINIEFSDIYSI